MEENSLWSKWSGAALNRVIEMREEKIAQENLAIAAANIHRETIDEFIQEREQAFLDAKVKLESVGTPEAEHLLSWLTTYHEGAIAALKNYPD